MARNAIPTAYRPRLWPKVVSGLVMALLLLLAVRNPVEAAHWLRATAQGLATMVDGIAEFTRKLNG
ncbi:hypothetical protein HFP15_19045 [Amycolatopsis sp. K13G38]|uniref:Uncharacterized protein n=1 Tax=Amycolatopsis acididurans TaxID=2724524 RepID=A0ABX1J7W4_9PSEU|nr:hypothetical protein [Amycolatopsis acididurans]NKQ54984.1 hypothetical protein [Amycolatopsis acididurans]